VVAQTAPSRRRSLGLSRRVGLRDLDRAGLVGLVLHGPHVHADAPVRGHFDPEQVHLHGDQAVLDVVARVLDVGERVFAIHILRPIVAGRRSFAAEHGWSHDPPVGRRDRERSQDRSADAEAPEERTALTLPLEGERPLIDRGVRGVVRLVLRGERVQTVGEAGGPRARLLVRERDVLEFSVHVSSWSADVLPPRAPLVERHDVVVILPGKRAGGFKRPVAPHPGQDGALLAGGDGAGRSRALARGRQVRLRTRRTRGLRKRRQGNGGEEEGQGSPGAPLEVVLGHGLSLSVEGF
jgi:hypothetical protein